MALPRSDTVARFLVVTVAVSFFYYTRFLGVDDEEYGRFPLLQEGLFPAFALFLLTWITTYNLFHI